MTKPDVEVADLLEQLVIAVRNINDPVEHMIADVYIEGVADALNWYMGLSDPNGLPGIHQKLREFQSRGSQSKAAPSQDRR